jgi:FkbM family methyltransferase
MVDRRATHPSPTGGRVSTLVLTVAPVLAVRVFEMVQLARGEPSLVVLREFAGPGDVAVDVGAHRGVYTSRLSRLVGSAGHVHAFEPNPESQSVLEAVVKRRRNVTLHATALSDHAGSAVLMRPLGGGGHRIDAMGSLSNPQVEAAPHDVVDVALARLDDELASESRRISLIKIDVEGHEQPVLEGATGVLADSRPALVLEIEQRHRLQPVSATFEWLAEQGYQGYVLLTAGRRPLEEFDLARDQLAFVGPGFHAGSPGAGYRNEFLFLPLAIA